MAQIVSIDLHDVQAKHGKTSELCLTVNPLDDGRNGFIWFENYFDYKNDFICLYNEVRSFTKSWAHSPEFKKVELGGVPVLDFIEHEMTSYWMQVRRDLSLVKNLIQQEKPNCFQITSAPINYDTIASCTFDPGLFEHILIKAAEVSGIPVLPGKDAPTASSYKQPWGRYLAGALAAQAKAFFKKTSCPDGRCILLTHNAWVRLGQGFIEKLQARGFVPVSLELSPDRSYHTVMQASGHRVSLAARLAGYQRIKRALVKIPDEIWNTVFTVDEHDFGTVSRRVVDTLMVHILWEIVYRIQLMAAFLENHQAEALLVIFDHNYTEGPGRHQAKLHKVKTITVQHGLLGPQIADFLPIESDLFASWGDGEKEVLVRQGVPGEKVAVIGFPQFDSKWRCSSDRTFKKPYRALIIGQGSRSSVEAYYAYTPTAILIRTLIEQQAELSDWRFTVRLHPNEVLDTRLVTSADAKGISVTKGRPLEEEMAEHDAIVTQFSTVGAQALLMGKPLVSLNWVSSREVVPFAGEGAAEVSASPADLMVALRNAVEKHGERKKAIGDFLARHLTDNKAAERLLDLCAN